ncbi:MAG TPA: twin-arginine translocase subunit TatC [Acidimicrobiales bacterium]|nr:twin-arginine translocase subunit TatC [Acidimicrobiales bacterium]
MTLVEHLAELRRRLVISIIAVGLGAIGGFFLYNSILSVLVHPYCHVQHLPAGTPCTRVLLVTDPLEPFTLRLKVAGWAGLFFASPVVLWELWRFVTPGLHPREKRYAIPFIVSSIALFSLGGLVAMLTFPQALHFLIYVGGNSLRTFFSPSKYLRLIILMILAFGIAFEFPVVLVSLELAGVLKSAQLRAWRRWAFLSIFVVAAVITPSADPFSMFAMAIPMYVFYEGAIVVGKLLKR